MLEENPRSIHWFNEGPSISHRMVSSAKFVFVINQIYHKSRYGLSLKPQGDSL